MKDFTVKKYKEILEAVIAVYGKSLSISDRLALGNDTTPFFMIRHDVDRKPMNSLKIAEIEHDMGLRSTYYFRIVKSSFDISIIKKIEALGHEIGYHYEDLSLARGNYSRAIELFENHLKKVRAVSPVSTIAMHGRPLSPYDNRNLWDKFRFEDFGINGEAFLSIDYKNIYYFTDTGRTWNPNSANLRDKVEFGLSADISTSNEMIDFVNNSESKNIALVTHPERWTDSFFEWQVSNAQDSIVNLIKIGLKVLYKYRK